MKCYKYTKQTYYNSCSEIHKRIFSSEGPFAVQIVSVKFHLSHVSRGVPQEQLLAIKHVGLQDIHISNLNREN